MFLTQFYLAFGVSDGLSKLMYVAYVNVYKGLGKFPIYLRSNNYVCVSTIRNPRHCLNNSTLKTSTYLYVNEKIPVFALICDFVINIYYPQMLMSTLYIIHIFNAYTSYRC